MRNDFCREIVQASNFIFQSSVFRVSAHKAAPEFFLHEIQHFCSVVVLRHAKAWFCLPADNKLLSPREGYGKASFTIGKAGYILTNISIRRFQRRRIMELWKRAHRSLQCSIHLGHRWMAVTSVDTGSTCSFGSPEEHTDFPRYSPAFSILPLCRTPARTSPL